ncbi:MAG: HD domain-containing protein, partial [Spirochaetaceae bacterium]|nr:HD domain-containing protein [Spirochaetaceae bacterium]
IPVIFLSAYIDPGHELEGLGLGAVDYIFKPFSPILLMRRIENHIIIAQQGGLKISEPAREPQNSIIRTLAELIEFPNSEPQGHIVRIQNYVSLLADRLMAEKIYTDETIAWDPASLVAASQLHDLGKIRIDNSLLNKPGKYSPEEFKLVKHHAGWGEKILISIERETAASSFLDHAKNFAAAHHERWDGTGYPLGLQNVKIPLEGRIMAIADVYDALISKRPYKDPLPPEEAKQIILSEKGRQFDPLLTDAFEAISEKFAEVAQTGAWRRKGWGVKGGVWGKTMAFFYDELYAGSSRLSIGFRRR